MQDFNQITLTGRLGRDPEMNFTEAGTAYTKFSIAVDRGGKNGQGDKTNEAMWFNVVCWQKLAENVHEYTVKGSKVLVQGRLDLRKYRDKNGVDRVAYDVIASTVHFLDNKRKEQSAAPDDGPLGEPEFHPF